MLRTLMIFLGLFLALNTLARPTSNVSNVIYSLPDDFFEEFGLPSMTFTEKRELIQGDHKLEKNGHVLELVKLDYRKMSQINCSEQDSDTVRTVFLQIVKDKKEKRKLLFVFSQLQKPICYATLIRVMEYDKDGTSQWKRVQQFEKVIEGLSVIKFTDIDSAQFSKIMYLRVAHKITPAKRAWKIDLVFNRSAEGYQVENELKKMKKEPKPMYWIWNKKEGKMVLVETAENRRKFFKLRQ